MSKNNYCEKCVYSDLFINGLILCRKKRDSERIFDPYKTCKYFKPPKTGVKNHWILKKDGSGICSKCGFISANIWDIMDDYQPYCGHCGAHMTGDAEKGW